MSARKIITIAILFIVAGYISKGQDRAELIDKLLAAYDSYGEFSGVVLVAEKGRIIYEKAFGFADREWMIPNTTDTKFRIASLSKPFTALMVLKLAEEGMIDLYKPITAYIPDYKGTLGDSITIHQLMNHTSGIITSLDPDEENIQERLYHSLREMTAFAESADLYFKPGKGFRYSNISYNILAYIIEKVTGKKYSDVLKEMITIPAGLSGTSQADNYCIEYHLARGYEYKLLNGFQNASAFDASYTTGPGGLISTARDLYLFDRALYTELLISDSTRKRIFTSQSSGNYGYGWFINRVVRQGKDTAIIADHSGSINGFGSYMARIMSDSGFVVVLKNQRSDSFIDPAYAPEIGKQIISILSGDNIEPPEQSVARRIGYILGNYGIDSAITEYKRILRYEPFNYSISEPELNKLGIELLFRFGMTDEALKIFELNMEQFPESYNTYDSYAYALMKKGYYEKSILFYRKGLEILNKYPEKNSSGTVKEDSERARVYIKEMEESCEVKKDHRIDSDDLAGENKQTNMFGNNLMLFTGLNRPI